MKVRITSRDGKLTGKFGYPSRPAPFGTGMEYYIRVWDGYGTFTKTRLGFGASMGF